MATPIPEPIESPTPRAGGAAPQGRLRRQAAGLLVGAWLGAALSYLLSLASFLPSMLGLFFYVLFGLVIGAGIYRLWAPLKPVSRRLVRVGVLVALLSGWGGALVWEASMFPADVAKEALKQVHKSPDKRGHELRAEADAAARAFLAERYPPGGVLGYWRWALSSDRVDIPIGSLENPRPIRYRGMGWFFILRVTLCGVALGLAVVSQLAPLARPEPVEEPSPTEVERS